MESDIKQVRSKNKIVTHIKGFHATYPSMPVFEKHRHVHNNLVVSSEEIHWGVLFPNEDGYDDCEWIVTVVRKKKGI
jgi:hypothetical protein